MKMPNISVIIPVYNAGEYLERCLESIVNQTLKDIEIICVDDCSTDNSALILNKYAEKDNRIKIIQHQTNCGESKARNTGLDNAAGKYLTFVDNDDSLDLNFLERLYISAIEKDADFSKGEVCITEYDGQQNYGDLNKKIRENNSMLFFAYHWWTAIYKTQIIKDCHIRFLEGYPLGGDVLFLNEFLLASNSYTLCDDVFYHYHKRQNSGDSKILSHEKIVSVLNIHEKIIDNLNNSSKKISDPKGTIFLEKWNLLSCINYAQRRKTEEALDCVIEKIFAIYKKINYKDIVLQEIEDTFLCEVNFIKNNDPIGFKNFYMSGQINKLRLIAKLRHSMNNN